MMTSLQLCPLDFSPKENRWQAQKPAGEDLLLLHPSYLLCVELYNRIPGLYCYQIYMIFPLVCP